MVNGSLSIDMFVGVHNDPRVNSDVVLYGLGSFLSEPLPLSLEYVYFVLANNGPAPFILDEFFLQIGPGEQGERIRDLDFPAKQLRGRVLHPGRRLGLGFLRDLLSRRLDWLNWRLGPAGEFVFRAGCALRHGATALSAPLRLSLACPANPMQDTELSPYAAFFARRNALHASELTRIREHYGSLRAYADMHLHLGMHTEIDLEGKAWRVLREWMPTASELWLTTERLGFGRDERYLFQRQNAGLWELRLPAEELPHGAYIELRLTSPLTRGKTVKRVPAFATRVEQNPYEPGEWCARVWEPEQPYVFRYDDRRKRPEFPRIYEAHIGIAQPSTGRTPASVGTFAEFRRVLLPRIREAGYTAVQLMGILEHPLYKSFGYQVSSYFAPSSRFGTPEDLRELIDTAHSLDLAVILDIPHSHAAPNTEQGLAQYDSSAYFFSDKGNQWGTASFNYRLDMTRRFLLSNCRYWLEAYHVDGFRFDAVGNMIYVDHGFGDDFSQADRCFFTADGKPRIDEAGVLYLSLANTLIWEIAPHAITLAEEFSGMPGMTSPPDQGGLGFDYRYAMGIPDFWASYIKQGGTVGEMWYEMNNHRPYEATVSYVSCHDQCINGKDAMIWRLIGDEMYETMSRFTDSLKTSRGVALYKLMRLVTLSTAGHGWLNFMGDEFGHPEWIDAAAYGHRQWHLPLQGHTRYSGLATFDRDVMLRLARTHAEDFAVPPRLRHLHEADATLAFERGNLLFAFNFSDQPQPGLELWVTPGKYVEMLSTDRILYAGHGNLEITEPAVEHFSSPGAAPDGAAQRIAVYLPPLVGLVLRRE